MFSWKKEMKKQLYNFPVYEHSFLLFKFKFKYIYVEIIVRNVVFFLNYYLPSG